MQFLKKAMKKLNLVKKYKPTKLKWVFPIITFIGLGLIIWSLMSIRQQSRFDISSEMSVALAASQSQIENKNSTASEIKVAKNPSILNDKRPQIGDFLGTLTIPALDRSLPIFEGTTEDQLSIGVGHVVTSVLPGWIDNSVIAGHRGTTFKNLDKLIIGDCVIIESKHGIFTYKIVNIRIVDSDDETVIVSTEKATLTLVTCYPLNLIGAAPKRYIIIAEMVNDYSPY